MSKLRLFCLAQPLLHCKRASDDGKIVWSMASLLDPFQKYQDGFEEMIPFVIGDSI